MHALITLKSLSFLTKATASESGFALLHNNTRSRMNNDDEKLGKNLLFQEESSANTFCDELSMHC